MTHNKKRNLGVVCDLIVNSIASDTIDGNKQRARVGINLLERYFGKGSPLVEEYAPFSVIREMRISDLGQASAALDKVLAAAQTVSPNLEHIKTSLIYEVNGIYGKDAWQLKIKDYRLYASLQQLISARKTGILAEARLTNERTVIIEHIMQPTIETGADILGEYDDPLIQAMMTVEFNKRYIGLPASNRKLLEAYVTHSIAGTLDEFNTKLDRYKQVLDARVNRALDAGVVAEHITKTIRAAQAVINETTGDDRVKLIMEYADLSRELVGNDGN